jgi:hypothetical protein
MEMTNSEREDEKNLPVLPFLGGLTDYPEGAVQDGDFWVDAAIAEPGAELEAKVRNLSACL